MSTTIMALVWPLQMPLTAKAVLVSLADQANDDGVCWPAVGTLCMRTCMSERTARNALRWLERTGAIGTAIRLKRDGSMSSNAYTVTPHLYRPELAGNQHAEEAIQGDQTPGTTCPLIIIEPTREVIHPRPPEGADEGPLIGLERMLELCRAAGEHAIPETDPVVTYAETVGIPRDILHLHWWVFKKRRIAARKRQRGVKGWRQAFRNSVEGNWYGLWFMREGQPAALTTQGLQAQAEREAVLAEQSRQRDLIEAANDEAPVVAPTTLTDKVVKRG
jgi:hypothetical protein